MDSIKLYSVVCCLLASFFFVLSPIIMSSLQARVSDEDNVAETVVNVPYSFGKYISLFFLHRKCCKQLLPKAMGLVILWK